MLRRLPLLSAISLSCLLITPVLKAECTLYTKSAGKEDLTPLRLTRNLNYERCYVARQNGFSIEACEYPNDRAVKYEITMPYGSSTVGIGGVSSINALIGLHSKVDDQEFRILCKAD